ncbi:MAG: ATP-binding protein [Bacteroidetes bacterium]|nr:ATP-binding protein [Bacteroidota bacterium]
MINKRLLVKNLLAHQDENSFYDKKRRLDLYAKEGKAKFLKHVCALSNSNPMNNSYIVVGVEDTDNAIVGVDFFDDSRIQNLIDAYMDHAPVVSYENIPFPHLPADKVVGLVTIHPNNKLTSLRRNIWKYWGGTVFFRQGSNSVPVRFRSDLRDTNSAIVASIERSAQNNIELTLDSVFDFIMKKHPDLRSQYKVFKEIFVLCWAGVEKKVNDKTYYSRLDIELVNEQVRLFYSALDEVSISYDSDCFSILEYVHLGVNPYSKYYPLEKVTIHFRENGTYLITNDMLFEPPQFDKKVMHHLYNANNALLGKLMKGTPLTEAESGELKNLANTYLLCYLNGFGDAKEKVIEAKAFLKAQGEDTYNTFKETMRIFRKLKYSG